MHNVTLLPFFYFLLHVYITINIAVFWTLCHFVIHILELKLQVFGDEDGMTTTGTLGRINKFEGTMDDWLQYVKHFFMVNSITSQ